MPETKTIKVTISGRVQGVFYRAHTKKAADNLKVTGWVKNNPNGNVEALFQAREDVLEKMTNWCHQGSANAVVSDVVTMPCPDSQTFTSFDIHY